MFLQTPRTPLCSAVKLFAEGMIPSLTAVLVEMVSPHLLLSPLFTLSLPREMRSLGWGSLLSLRSSACENNMYRRACINGAKCVHSQLVRSRRFSPVALLSICNSSLAARTEAHWTFRGSSVTFRKAPRV